MDRLQNRQGGAALRLDGSVPSPLREAKGLLSGDSLATASVAGTPLVPRGDMAKSPCAATAADRKTIALAAVGARRVHNALRAAESAALRPQAGGQILQAMSREGYLLADQPSELERLQLQSRVWEPTGRQLLSKLDDGSARRALDIGCGALGWLRILGEWVGPSGRVVGTDIDEGLLDAARSFLDAEGISNVELVVDDLFESKLEPRSFDLVHARYQIAPLGRGPEQVATYRRLVKLGGRLALEEWDLGSWHFNPPAPAADRLIRLISEIFAALGGEAGR